MIFNKAPILDNHYIQNKCFHNGLQGLMIWFFIATQTYLWPSLLGLC